MDRALPAWAVDLIRDGAPTVDLKQRGNRAVWSALVRTAASAQARGQDRMEWEALVIDPASRLGSQVRLRDGRKARRPLDVEKTLSKAWEAAWEWRTEAGDAWDREEVAERARGLAAAVWDVVADPDATLSDRERSVLAYAAAQTAERGMLRVALPWRAVMDATGLTEKVTKATLRRLTDRGLLVLEVPGRSGATKRRANLYAFPAGEFRPSCMPGNPAYGTSRQTYGTSLVEGARDLRHTYGTSQGTERPRLRSVDAQTTTADVDAQPTTAEEPAMPAATLTLTLTPEEQAAVLETLQRVRAADHDEDRTTSDARVVPLRRPST